VLFLIRKLKVVFLINWKLL